MVEQYPPKIEKEVYPESLSEQINALEDSGQLAEFRKYREEHHNDPWEPAYHFSAPDGVINDPNGLSIWEGKMHMFYQAYPPEDFRQHWGHTVSSDMVNWVDLPLAIYPGLEHAVFSGSALVEEDRVIAMYHGTRAGNMIATSSDPLLLNWTKHPDNPVIEIMPGSEDGKPYRIFDPFIWREDDGYYALSGTYYGPEFTHNDGRSNQMVEHLFFSQDLARWTYIGELLDDYTLIERGNDGACPYFWPIGNKHVLFFFSHQTGPYALVGDYDKRIHKFTPKKKVKFNYGPLGCSSLQAPCLCPDNNGGLYLVFNTKDANHTLIRKGTMTIMMHVTLENDELIIRPVENVKKLWDKEEIKKDVLVKAFDTIKLDTRSNMLDLNLSIDMKDSRAVTVKLLASDDGREYTSITIYKIGRNEGGSIPPKLCIAVDSTNASLCPDIQGRMPEACEIPSIKDGVVELRILVDKCILDIFANNRQYLMQMVYPTLPDANEISITSIGNDASVDVELHTMKPMCRKL